MKFKIIILRILFIISLIISVFFISDTFAKYQESINTNYKSNIKRWKMIVNDHVIRNGETLINLNEAGIEPIFKNHEYIADDVIVPGREGYFEIPINFEKVDVPFTLDLNIQQYETSLIYNNLLDFQFYGYKIGNSETIYYNLPAEYKQVEYLELNDTEKLEINVKYDNNLIVSQLIPCYRVSDGVIGMYDMVTKSFITDFWEGIISKGEDIEKEIIDSKSEKYQDIEKEETIYAYIRWLEGDGTTESLIDVFNNTDDTAFVTNGENTEVQYKATIVFEQYIKE